MYICIYIYTYIHTYIHTHTHMYTVTDLLHHPACQVDCCIVRYMYVFVCVSVCVCLNKLMRVCICNILTYIQKHGICIFKLGYIMFILVPRNLVPCTRVRVCSTRACVCMCKRACMCMCKRACVCMCKSACMCM
jgi:hypothetical protein